MNDREAAARLSRYEGLVRATTNLIAPHVEVESDDIEQRLRVKVWRALLSFDPKKWRKPGDEAERRYVFMCVANEKKDILDLRRRAELYVETLVQDGTDELLAASRSRDSFEQQYLSIEAEHIFGDIEDDDLTLPSTLTYLERQVIVRLYCQRYQTEAALELGLSKGEMERTMASIRAKLSDWRPSAAESGSVHEPPLPRRQREQQRAQAA